jgi:hypothetical protein
MRLSESAAWLQGVLKNFGHESGCAGIGWIYIPSLVQAAAKAAKRHTASTSSALDFMVGVARGLGARRDEQVIGTVHACAAGSRVVR